MKKLISNSIPFVLILTVMSCSKDVDVNNQPEPTYTVEADNFIFYQNKTKFEDASAHRGDENYCLFDWSILNVSRIENTLTIDISRPADCEVDYEVIWDGNVMFTSPPFVNLFIKAVSEDCHNQEEIITDQLVVDLDEIFLDLVAIDLSNTNFLIKDFCSLKDINCEDNCDVNVSNN